MNKMYSVVFAMAASATAFGQDAVQWRTDLGGNGHWYRHVSQGLNWAQARAAAEAMGGYLATTSTAAENSFIAGLVTSHEAWIGGFQEPGVCEPGCDWKWVTGEAWEFAGWAPGEPNDWGDEDGVMLWPSGQWNDGMTWVGATFVVEWSADCNADGVIDFEQIRDGVLADVNGNGVPDVCQPPTCADADIVVDAQVDGADLEALLGAWGTATAKSSADLNGDGNVDGFDLGLLLGLWGPCN